MPVDDGIGLGVYEYDDTLLATTLRVITTVVASLLPICSIILLYFVQSDINKLCLIVTASGFFAMALALMTNARMIEVFAATSA
jgi:uncharacterized membrane protein YccC